MKVLKDVREEQAQSMELLSKEKKRNEPSGGTESSV
jgi:hypothetical protein